MRSFKKNGVGIFCSALALALLICLDFALYPCTYVRNDIHTVLTKKHDDIFLGTSHGKMSIVPEVIEKQTGRSAHNLCVGGEYSVDAYYLAKLLTEKNPPSRIIYELDPAYYMTQKEEGNNYLLFYHEFPLSWAKAAYFKDTLPDCDFRTILFPWYEYALSYEIKKLPQTVFQKWNHNYDVSHLAGKAQEYHPDGFIERYPINPTSIKPATPRLFEKEKVRQHNVEYLQKLIALCREKDISLVVITTPIPANTLKPNHENFQAAWDYFFELLTAEGVPYLNFNREYYKAYSHDLTQFTDYDGHMHGDAAREFSEILGKLLPKDF